MKPGMVPITHKVTQQSGLVDLRAEVAYLHTGPIRLASDRAGAPEQAAAEHLRHRLFVSGRAQQVWCRGVSLTVQVKPVQVSPDSSAMGSASNWSTPMRRTPTLLCTTAPRHAASVRSARNRCCNSAASANGVLLKLPRYCLSDCLSIRLTDSQGTEKCASATCGLPRGLSQLSSNAVRIGPRPERAACRSARSAGAVRHGGWGTAVRQTHHSPRA